MLDVGTDVSGERAGIPLTILPHVCMQSCPLWLRRGVDARPLGSCGSRHRSSRQSRLNANRVSLQPTFELSTTGYPTGTRTIMGVVHIVLFEFKPTASREQVRDVSLPTGAAFEMGLYLTCLHQACERMLELREKCLHPTTNKPYVKSSVGGRDNSPEGHQVV